MLLGRPLVKRAIRLRKRAASHCSETAQADAAMPGPSRDCGPRQRPARARATPEQGRPVSAGADPAAADMLISGEGGPANPKGASLLLAGRRA